MFLKNEQLVLHTLLQLLREHQPAVARAGWYLIEMGVLCDRHMAAMKKQAVTPKLCNLPSYHGVVTPTYHLSNQCRVLYIELSLRDLQLVVQACT